MIIKKNDRTCIRVCNLHDRDADRDLADTTASERMGMMWQLALDAWAFKGETVAEFGFQRHAVSIQRRKS